MREVLDDTEERMKKTVEFFRKDLATLRAGRATPALVEKIMVDYYGTPTPIQQLASISVPEPRLLVVQPWDKTQVAAVEKAIAKSDLGIHPQSDGNVIRLVIPQLTEERRNELVRLIRKKAEEERVVLRNLRREANDLLKEAAKEGEISEDERDRALSEVQKLTDRYVAEVDKVLKAKEKELMEV
ncbi:MAG TPA: ribosome recycling factor [Clostridiales bacterium]|nr:ribosome recycling factor [Clostridiales bacterium]